MASSRHHEHRESADRAGLVYVTDAFRGIRRKRVGTGWAFYTPDGGLVTDRAERRRLLRLAIPPAWTDVWICPDPAGHIQVTARDDRGRKQYRYHPAYRATRDHSKFRRILTFSERLPAVRERVERDLGARDLSRRQILATVVRLLDRTLVRVGNDEYARTNRSFGLTTLRGRHVKVTGDQLRFSFRGKSGVQHTITLNDRRVARIIQCCQDLPGQELFQYLDPAGRRQTVSSGDVNDYLREIAGPGITAKDFRTWAGTMLAVRELRAAGAPASATDAERRILAALDAVATRLGNTRTVCRQYYVHPGVLQAYREGRTASPPAPPAARRERPTAALRREEIAVLQFLQALDVPEQAAVPGLRQGQGGAARRPTAAPRRQLRST
ncbi:MAG: DNA topoisomerase IB [Gemmatimonadetes bacterium]|nr:DNA topoisomerase IB [Gemmatimonadota bacterium]MBK7786599.1 DNA topoisomerase IB [Gemmatimonadota bacterium]